MRAGEEPDTLRALLEVRGGGREGVQLDAGKAAAEQDHTRQLARKGVVDSPLGQRVQAAVVVVERILVHLRPLGDVADGHLGVRLLGEGAPERLLHPLDGGWAFLIFARSWHGQPLYWSAELISAIFISHDI